MTPTIQQRIELLKRHGDFDPVLIAGILGLDLADVVGVLADPVHVPSSVGEVRPVDLGVIDAAALSTGGPKVLYTPQSGEYIDLASLRFRDFTAFVTSPNSGGNVIIATPTLLATAVANGGAVGTYFDTDLCSDGFQFGVTGNGYVAGNASSTGLNAVVGPLDGDPLTAYYSGLNAAYVDSVPGVWQANHAYAGGEWIIATDPINGGDWLWQASAGTSGNSLPVLDNTISPISDNTTTWTVHGDVATDGSIHAYVNVWTPGAS